MARVSAQRTSGLLNGGFQGVEDDAADARVPVGLDVGEVLFLEIAAGRGIGLDDRADGGEVQVDHIDFVARHGDDARGEVAVIDEHHVLRLRLAKHHAGRGLGPVRAFLPGGPVAGRVEAVQLVRARAEGRVVLEGKEGLGVNRAVAS